MDRKRFKKLLPSTSPHHTLPLLSFPPERCRDEGLSKQCGKTSNNTRADDSHYGHAGNLSSSPIFTATGSPSGRSSCQSERGGALPSTLSVISVQNTLADGLQISGGGRVHDAINARLDSTEVRSRAHAGNGCTGRNGVKGRGTLALACGWE